MMLRAYSQLTAPAPGPTPSTHPAPAPCLHHLRSQLTARTQHTAPAPCLHHARHSNLAAPAPSTLSPPRTQPASQHPAPAPARARPAAPTPCLHHVAHPPRHPVSMHHAYTQHRHPVCTTCTASSQHQHPHRHPAPATCLHQVHSQLTPAPGTTSGTRHPAPAPAPATCFHHVHSQLTAPAPPAPSTQHQHQQHVSTTCTASSQHQHPAPPAALGTQHQRRHQQPVSTTCTASSQHQRAQPAHSTSTGPSTSTGTRHSAPAPATCLHHVHSQLTAPATSTSTGARHPPPASAPTCLHHVRSQLTAPAPAPGTSTSNLSRKRALLSGEILKRKKQKCSFFYRICLSPSAMDFTERWRKLGKNIICAALAGSLNYECYRRVNKIEKNTIFSVRGASGHLVAKQRARTGLKKAFGFLVPWENPENRALSRTCGMSLELRYSTADWQTSVRSDPLTWKWKPWKDRFARTVPVGVSGPSLDLLLLTLEAAAQHGRVGPPFLCAPFQRVRIRFTQLPEEGEQANKHPGVSTVC